MKGPPDPTLLDRARGAVSRSDWREAYDLLLQADAGGLLAPVDLPLLAEVAYAAGYVDVTIEVWERTHRECLAAGEAVAAAGAAAKVALHLLIDTGLMAPVRAWITRADRLLEGREETAVHAWLSAARAYERLLIGDWEVARRWARMAIAIGTGREPAAAAIGRVAEARSFILAGEVRPGLALLDEAAVAAVSGELDPLSTGIVYCELVCALQGAAQYDLAEEWTRAMERWRPGGAIGSLHGRCRVHRAEILRLRGACHEAEREALLACDELRPYVRRELGWPLVELGRIRLVKGDVAGAEEAFLAAVDVGWDAQPGLSLARLARGDVPAAAAGIREALDSPSGVPSKELPANSELRRAPLLAAAVDIELAAGALDRARAAADELAGVADRFESKALAATAALAEGRLRLASGDASAAEGRLALAVRLWEEVGAPYEASLARSAHREALRARGEPRRGSPSVVGATDDAVVRPADRHTFHREGDTWLVVFAGRATRVRDLKGMHYLSRLLAEPGRELESLDLVALESRGRLAAPQRGDAGEMLDARAKRAYRRRLGEIEADLEEARALGDATRITQAEEERSFLVRELSRAVGLGGRDRTAGSASERARASVTRAIRHAMARLREHDRALGEHLDHAIRTGACCSYAPDPRVPARWSS